MIYLTKNDWKNLFHPSKETIEAREQYHDYLNKNIQTEEINGEYFCPVKEKHMDNVNATCHYCIAKQNPNI